MGRPPRLQFPGACYFISLQGNNRQDIFLSGQDRRHFLALLRAAKERYGLTIYAYTLMSRDAQLLIETAEANLSEAMQRINTLYTKHFNSQHDTVGHVLGGRYKALLVDKENYLAELSRYIHLAPVRAGLREKPWRYPWSSGPAYVQSDAGEPLVDTGPVLAHFGKVRLVQSVRYLQYLKDLLPSAADIVLPVTRGAAIGSEEFLERAERRGAAAPAPKPSQEAEARQVIAEVASRHGFDAERLTGRLQWRELAEARRKAIHRLWKETRLGVTEISRLFNRTPSWVSQIVRSLETPTAS